MTRPLSAKPSRAWQRMLSGRRLDLLEPSPDDIDIEDIAHGLARVARWNGQTTGPHAFSVAQHSLIVMDILAARDPQASNQMKLAALLHDAPEYVIGDLISPFKSAIGLDYKAFERRLLTAIHLRFGLPGELTPKLSSAIKDADRIAAFYEATVLAGFELSEAREYFGHPDVVEDLDIRLQGLQALPANDAEERFLVQFNALTRL